MNSNKASRARRSALSRQLLVQYVLSVVGFVFGFVLVFFFGLVVCSQIIWHDTDPLYRFLRILWDTAPLWCSFVILVGIVLITYYYLAKPLRYLDEVVLASKQLAQPNDEPIVLNSAMYDTENELNLVREQSLRNAAAAKEAEQRKNDLIVYLAHDLKTPLTSVIGYLTLLRDESDISPELRAKYTGIALDKALRLEDLINEFFDITRFNLTSLVLELERVNLTRMLEQITNEFGSVLLEKRLIMETKLAPDVDISCDPDKLERVFDNLLRNAVNYSYPGSSICLTLEGRNTQAVVTVQNSGKTIPPEKLSKIFEQFFRMDSSRASATGGAGLGLAIAKEIVELHGGTIAAESAEERNIFTVKLPIHHNSV